MFCSSLLSGGEVVRSFSNLALLKKIDHCSADLSSNSENISKDMVEKLDDKGSKNCCFNEKMECQKRSLVESPKIITPEWEEKVFGVKPGEQTLIGSLHEMIDGLIEVEFGPDFFAKVEEALKKQPTGEGVYTEYWPNGIKRAEIPFKNGKAHGHVHGWYANKKDAFKGFFKEGVKQGIHITFFWSDITRNDRDAHVLWFNEKGQLDGNQLTSHRTGRLWVAADYVNGKLNGALEAWPINGSQCLSADYKNGVLQKNPPPPPGKRVQPKMSVAEKCAREIINDFEDWAFAKYGLHISDFGASMVNDIEEIEVDFGVIGKTTIDEAREMFITLNEKLTEMVNKHEKIRPYLREYPFARTRIDVVIGFYNKYGVRNTDGSIACVLVGKNDVILYMSDSPNSREYKDIFEEPYENALKIVTSKKEEKKK